MRTKEECEIVLKDCKEKRDFWRKKLRELDELKQLEYSHQRTDYEDQHESWTQRVNTLEYVLGIREVI